MTSVADAIALLNSVSLVLHSAIPTDLSFVPEFLDLVINGLTLAVLAVTGFIVWRYTQAAQRSNDISERPILNLSLRTEKQGSNEKHVLVLRNIGGGPALNIEIPEIRAGGFEYRLRFKERDFFLGAGEGRDIDFVVRTPTGGVEHYDGLTGWDFFTERLFPHNTGQDFEQSHEAWEKSKKSAGVVLVHYEGVNMVHYHSVFRLYPRIWPGRDIVVEFIAYGTGTMSRTKAKGLGERKEVRNSAYAA